MLFKSVIISSLLFLSAFITLPIVTHAQSVIRNGPWRGVFSTASGAQVPFNFEIRGKMSTTAKAYLINGTEKLEGDALWLRGDSLFIAFSQFDNELALKLSNDSRKLTGVLHKRDGSGKGTPVEAEYDVQYRFADNGEKPAADISGKYDVRMTGHDGNKEKRVALFRQQDGKLYATFMSITGDSRYLEGVVQGSKFYLSSFIGSGIAYYTGSIDSADHLSGAANGQVFTAVKNDSAALADPYKLTYLKPGYTRFDFSLPNLDGKKISLQDRKYRNKVVILTITGTWCPNCTDEARFLAPWYKANHSRGVEAIAIHYERKPDPAYLKAAIGNYKRKYGITYDEVIGGTVGQNAVAESLPALNSFVSYPTIIFINKQGKVDKIYTGFYGPATGEYYEEFIKEFNEEVDGLLKG